MLCSLYFVRNVLCKVFKRFFSSVSVILCIKFYPDILIGPLIDDNARQILQRIQRLSSLSDEHSHISAAEINIHDFFFLIKGHVNLHFHTHGTEYIFQELPSFIHHIIFLPGLNYSRLISDESQKSGRSLFNYFIFQFIAGNSQLNQSFCYSVIHCLSRNLNKISHIYTP